MPAFNVDEFLDSCFNRHASKESVERAYRLGLSRGPEVTFSTPLVPADRQRAIRELIEAARGVRAVAGSVREKANVPWAPVSEVCLQRLRRALANVGGES